MARDQDQLLDGWRAWHRTEISRGDGSEGGYPLLASQLRNGDGIVNLADKKIGTCPPGLDKFPDLDTIEFGDNRLKSLPAEFGDIKSLTDLDVSKNQLASLPKEMVKLENLKTLRISDNKFTELPSWLNQLPKLENIYVDGNQLPGTTPAVLSNGAKVHGLDRQTGRIAAGPEQTPSVPSRLGYFMDAARLLTDAARMGGFGVPQSSAANEPAQRVVAPNIESRGPVRPEIRPGRSPAGRTDSDARGSTQEAFGRNQTGRETTHLAHSDVSAANEVGQISFAVEETSVNLGALSVEESADRSSLPANRARAGRSSASNQPPPSAELDPLVIHELVKSLRREENFEAIGDLTTQWKNRSGTVGPSNPTQNAAHRKAERALNSITEMYNNGVAQTSNGGASLGVSRDSSLPESSLPANPGRAGRSPASNAPRQDAPLDPVAIHQLVKDLNRARNAGNEESSELLRETLTNWRDRSSTARLPSDPKEVSAYRRAVNVLDNAAAGLVDNEVAQTSNRGASSANRHTSVSEETAAWATVDEGVDLGEEVATNESDFGNESGYQRPPPTYQQAMVGRPPVNVPPPASNRSAVPAQGQGRRQNPNGQIRQNPSTLPSLDSIRTTRPLASSPPLPTTTTPAGRLNAMTHAMGPVPSGSNSRSAQNNRPGQNNRSGQNPANNR